MFINWFFVYSSSRSLVQRFRPPRTFSLHGPPLLTTYDYERASGEDILRNINNGRFSSEKCLGHIGIGSSLLVATTNHLLFTMNESVHNQSLWTLNRSSFLCFFLCINGKNGIEYLDFNMFDEYSMENLHTNEDFEDYIEARTGSKNIISIRILLLVPLRSSRIPITTHAFKQSKALSFPYIEIKLISKDGKNKVRGTMLQLIKLLIIWEGDSKVLSPMTLTPILTARDP